MLAYNHMYVVDWRVPEYTYNLFGIQKNSTKLFLYPIGHNNTPILLAQYYLLVLT